MKVKDPAVEIRLAIDRELQKLQSAQLEDVRNGVISDGIRHHLGASVLGQACMRQVFYDFRWAHVTQHTGRLLRLFARGHMEEERVCDWLKLVGIHVQRFEEHDIDKFKQHNFEDFGSHFGGSADGIITSAETFGLDGRGLFECKTHNTKSFVYLTENRLLKAKPEHHAQIQVYMHYLELPWALYSAVNKNDDDLYFEVVQYQPTVANMLILRAKGVLIADNPPRRINEDPSFWLCKFCDHRDVCHKGDAPRKSCRTCKYALCRIKEGDWLCEKYGQSIPKDFQVKGCDAWERGF